MREPDRALLHVERFDCGRDGVRLDRLVADTLACGRRTAREWIRSGCVRVDGRRLPAASRVARGSVVSIVPAPASTTARLPELEILSAGADWIAVAKPAGVHSVDSASDANSIARTLRARDAAFVDASPQAHDAGLVHRLDRDTSGVLIAARSREAWLRLREQFRSRRVRKLYLALVAGAVTAPFTVDQPLARRRTRVRIPRRGERALDAVSDVVPLLARASWSLVCISMRTGVTHQIRAHLAIARHPILGDPTYGGVPAPPATRSGQLLHAARLIVPGEFDVTARAPADFMAALHALRRE